MAEDNVVELPVVTSLDLPPERILNKALKMDLKGVVVMGYGQDGSEYFASSISDGPEVLWLMERWKLDLLRHDEGEE